MENSDFLGKEKVNKLLLKFSIPCILSLLIGALYNIADQIFIGNSSVGILGNTATTVVYPITVVALALALFLGDGTAAYISLCLGKEENDKIHKSVGNMILFSIIFSAVLILFVAVFMNPVLHALGGNDGNGTVGSYDLAHDYCTIILFGVPFYIVSTALGCVIRSDGNPKYAMLATLAGAIINIALDPIFIFAFNLGIKGAAYATIIGQIVSFILTFIYLFKAKTFKLTFKSFMINGSILLHIFKLGISSFLTQISIVIMSVVTNIVLKKYGSQISDTMSDNAVAIYGIVMKIYGIVISIIVGIAAGGQPVVGYNYGAGHFDRVRKTYYYIVASSLAIVLVFFILFETIPGSIIGLFGSSNDTAYIEFGKKTLRIYLLLILFTSVLKVSAIYLQSLGNPLKATVLSLSRDIVVLVPLTIILPIFMGIDGVLWAAPISDIIGITVTVTLIVLELKKLRKLELAKNKE